MKSKKDCGAFLRVGLVLIFAAALVMAAAFQANAGNAIKLTLTVKAQIEKVDFAQGDPYSKPMHYIFISDDGNPNTATMIMVRAILPQ